MNFATMKIFIVSATSFEFGELKQNLQSDKHDIQFFEHGIGLMMSAFTLGKLTTLNPDLIIQCGIAGCYTNSLQIGETVIVETETLGDTGAEDQEGSLNLVELNLIEPNTYPFINQKLQNPYLDSYSINLKKVNSLSVNLASGSLKTIEQRTIKYQADIESMEGASLHYACLTSSIPFVQFRGISNYVEPRNKENWNIPLAIQNYQQHIISFIEQL
jgi:futalosine hydrolase